MSAESPTAVRVPRMDPAPLRAFVERHVTDETTWSDLSLRIGYTSPDSLKKVVERGPSIWTVDRVCCGLGSHPSLVYGSLWWEACDE